MHSPNACQAAVGKAARHYIVMIGEDGQNKGVNWGNDELGRRGLRSDLKPQDGLPEDTILWAHLQSLSGGAWNGCVYDFELINKSTS